MRFLSQDQLSRKVSWQTELLGAKNSFFTIVTIASSYRRDRPNLFDIVLVCFLHVVRYP